MDVFFSFLVLGMFFVLFQPLCTQILSFSSLSDPNIFFVSQQLLSITSLSFQKLILD